MKKFSFIPLLMILLFSLTSCLPQNTEIKYRLIIEGIGIDYDSEKEEFILTVQVLETAKSSSDKESKGAPTVNYTAKGKTVAEAITSLGENTGKYPLYSQNRMIILGESVTDDVYEKALNFFVREYTSRPDVFIAAAKGKASDVLNLETGSEIPAKLIESAIEQSHKNSVSVATELYNAVNLSLEKNTAFALPLIETAEGVNTEGKTIRVNGSRIFSGGNKSPEMSEEETFLYLFAMNDISEGTFSINTGGKATGLEIISSSTKVRTDFTNGRPVFSVSVKCRVDVVEFGSESFSDFSDEDIKNIEKAASEYLKSGLEKLYERFLKTEKADVFRFGKKIEQRGMDNTGTENYEVRVSADVKVGRIGQMTVK